MELFGGKNLQFLTASIMLIMGPFFSYKLLSVEALGGAV